MRTLIFSVSLIFLVGCSQKSEVAKNPEMVALNNISVSFIKGEEFVMGTYEDVFLDKAPRKVMVDDFYMDKTEVTNASYRTYMAEAGGKVRKPKYLDDPEIGADNLPVVAITHQEAKDFCAFYNKRLPTEAEWEFAAKGGTEFTKYFWGDDENTMLMNYRESKKGTAVAVGSYPPNVYGLYDMNGNVREWVADSYEKDFYKYACYKISGKKSCYANPLNEQKTIYKSNRGGSFEYSKGYPPTISFRFFDEEDSENKDVGFRCAAGEIDE